MVFYEQKFQAYRNLKECPVCTTFRHHCLLFFDCNVYPPNHHRLGNHTHSYHYHKFHSKKNINTKKVHDMFVQNEKQKSS